MTTVALPSAPLVSVVLPTYGRPDKLRRALLAVIDQTFTDWELIVVDDNGAGSELQRRTEDVVRHACDPAVLHYVVHERNRGGGAARNTGIEHARGTYVAFLDDDDAWDADKLAWQLDRFAASPPSVALVYCRSRVVDEVTGSERPWRARPPKHGLRDLLRRNTVGSTGQVLVRRAALLEVGGFDERLPAKQDIDLYVRLALSWDFAFVDRTLHTIYRHTEASIGKDLAGTVRAHEIFHEKHAALIDAYPDVRYHRSLALGTLLLVAERRVEARRELWRAWRVAPARPSVWLQLALAYGLPRAPARALVRRWRRRRADARTPVEDAL